MYSNGLVIISAIISMIADNIEAELSSVIVLCLGRFIYGLACGAYSVLCSKFISETAPVEIKGPVGFLIQVYVTFGIVLAFLVGFIFDTESI